MYSRNCCVRVGGIRELEKKKNKIYTLLYILEGQHMIFFFCISYFVWMTPFIYEFTDSIYLQRYIRKTIVNYNLFAFDNPNILLFYSTFFFFFFCLSMISLSLLYAIVINDVVTIYYEYDTIHTYSILFIYCVRQCDNQNYFLFVKINFLHVFVPFNDLRNEFIFSFVIYLSTFYILIG